MVAKDDFQNLLKKIDTEDIKAQLDIVPVVPETSSPQDDPSTHAEGFGFRPLTEKEKEEFIGCLDSEGKQLLAELAGDVKTSREPVDDPSSGQRGQTKND